MTRIKEQSIDDGTWKSRKAADNSGRAETGSSLPRQGRAKPYNTTCTYSHRRSILFVETFWFKKDMNSGRQRITGSRLGLPGEEVRVVHDDKWYARYLLLRCLTTGGGKITKQKAEGEMEDTIHRITLIFLQQPARRGLHCYYYYLTGLQRGGVSVPTYLAARLLGISRPFQPELGYKEWRPPPPCLTTYLPASSVFAFATFNGCSLWYVPFASAAKTFTATLCPPSRAQPIIPYQGDQGRQLGRGRGRLTYSVPPPTQ
ncbi:hypothetical protein L249_7343, partial [Ophiocordyceps polyrhachis-furcata BCC 54312]